MNNIFIEGIQGAGKTTLLNNIANAGLAFQMVREGDYSPVDLAWCAWLKKQEYKALIERYEQIKNEIEKIRLCMTNTLLLLIQRFRRIFRASIMILKSMRDTAAEKHFLSLKTLSSEGKIAYLINFPSYFFFFSVFSLFYFLF